MGETAFHFTLCSRPVSVCVPIDSQSCGVDRGALTSRGARRLERRSVVCVFVRRAVAAAHGYWRGVRMRGIDQ